MHVAIDTIEDPIRAQQLRAVLAELLTPRTPLVLPSPDQPAETEDFELAA